MSALHVTKTFVPRRSHRKSREGCAACKQRRIKCDELRPSCSSCLRRSVACDYPNANNPRNAAPAHGEPVVLPSQITKYSASETSSVRTLLRSSADVQVPDWPLSLLDGGDCCAALRSTLDLRLLQHFTLDVSRTLAEESKDITLWQRVVPSIGFKYAFVMHGLLAVSALSYARQSLGSKASYIARADMHHALTLPPFIRELNDPNDANIDALYVASVLLSFHHFAKGPQPGQYLIFGDQSQPEWLGLLAGVRAMIQRRGRMPLEDIDRIHAEHSSFPAEMLLQVTRVPALEHTEPIKQLRHLIQGLTGDTTSYRSAVDNLEMCFVDAFVDDGHPAGVRPRNHLIMAWLYLLDPVFLKALQEKDPWALIIVAHFATVLNRLQHCWLMHDWGLHLMDGVDRHLHAQHKPWLQWPAAVLDWQPSPCPI